MATDPRQTTNSSLMRRLGALLYDLMLLTGVLMLANAVVTIPYQVFTGHAFYESAVALNLTRLYLLAVVGLFYVYFWTHGGQTLGMRAWHLRVERMDGSTLDTITAIKRFGWSLVSLIPAGIGLWMSLFNRERLALHDSRTATRVVHVA